MTRQNVALTVTGDQGADSPLETHVGVRVASQPCFHEREAGAGAAHRKRQQRDLPRRRKGNARRKPRNEAESHCVTEAKIQMFKWPSFPEGVHHHQRVDRTKNSKVHHNNDQRLTSNVKR